MHVCVLFLVYVPVWARTCSVRVHAIIRVRYWGPWGSSVSQSAADDDAHLAWPGLAGQAGQGALPVLPQPASSPQKAACQMSDAYTIDNDLLINPAP